MELDSDLDCDNRIRLDSGVNKGTTGCMYFGSRSSILAKNVYTFLAQPSSDFYAKAPITQANPRQLHESKYSLHHSLESNNIKF